MNIESSGTRNCSSALNFTVREPSSGIINSVSESFSDSRHMLQPILLRPHHGMCLSFFQGKGYSNSFSAHMSMMKQFLEEKDPMIRLTVHTDVICTACPNNMNSVCTSADKVSRYDHAVLESCGLSEEECLPYSAFHALTEEKILHSGKREQICGDCQWNDLCR